ncbi:MAG: hypothetical protein R3B68_00035 [Phycisphaerales bacterium]
MRRMMYIDHSVGRACGRSRPQAWATTRHHRHVDSGTTFNGEVDRAFFDSLGRLRDFKLLYEGRDPRAVRGVVARADRPGTTRARWSRPT